MFPHRRLALCHGSLRSRFAGRWIASEVAVRTGEPAPGGGAPVEARVAVRHAGGAMKPPDRVLAPAAARFHTGFEIATRTTVLRHDSDHGDRLSVRGAGSPGATTGGPDTDPLAAELTEFLGAIRTGTPPRVSAEDGRAALAVALAAVESAATGRPVVPVG